MKNCTRNVVLFGAVLVIILIVLAAYMSGVNKVRGKRSKDDAEWFQTTSFSSPHNTDVRRTTL
jgi:hypothetical protein